MEVNPETMESLIVPGLFFAGEVLDVAGPCGGYNLQFAFSTGAIAGMGAGRQIGRIFMELLWIIFLLILVFFTAAGIYFALRILKPKFNQRIVISGKNPGRQIRSMNSTRPLSKQEVWIPSPYGYKLHGIYLPLEGSHKTVVITHGIETTLYASVKYVELFRSIGFQCPPL